MSSLQAPCCAWRSQLLSRAACSHTVFDIEETAQVSLARSLRCRQHCEGRTAQASAALGRAGSSPSRWTTRCEPHSLALPSQVLVCSPHPPATSICVWAPAQMLPCDCPQSLPASQTCGEPPACAHPAGPEGPG